MSGRTRVTVRVHLRARTGRPEWDGPALQLWVREPPADGRANAAVIRAVARWADVAQSQVAIAWVELLFPAWILLLSVDILRAGLRQSPGAAGTAIGAQA